MNLSLTISLRTLACCWVGKSSVWWVTMEQGEQSIFSILWNKLYHLSRSYCSVGVEEIPDDKFFKFLSGYLTVLVFVDDLNVWSNVCCSGRKTSVHGSVAIDQPFRNLNSLANTISVTIIGINNFSESNKYYLARLRHSSRVKRPPFSTWLKLVSWPVFEETWDWA